MLFIFNKIHRVRAQSKKEAVWNHGVVFIGAALHRLIREAGTFITSKTKQNEPLLYRNKKRYSIVCVG